MTTSPSIPSSRKHACALRMQAGSVRSSLRHGITALTMGCFMGPGKLTYLVIETVTWVQNACRTARRMPPRPHIIGASATTTMNQGTQAFNLSLLWIVGSIAALVVGLAPLAAAVLNGHYTPIGPDGFYH